MVDETLQCRGSIHSRVIGEYFVTLFDVICPVVGFLESQFVGCAVELSIRVHVRSEDGEDSLGKWSRRIGFQRLEVVG